MFVKILIISQIIGGSVKVDFLNKNQINRFALPKFGLFFVKLNAYL
jgi:hypothetical protein